MSYTFNPAQPFSTTQQQAPPTSNMDYVQQQGILRAMRLQQQGLPFDAQQPFVQQAQATFPTIVQNPSYLSTANPSLISASNPMAFLQPQQPFFVTQQLQQPTTQAAQPTQQQPSTPQMVGSQNPSTPSTGQQQPQTPQQQPMLNGSTPSNAPATTPASQEEENQVGSNRFFTVTQIKQVQELIEGCLKRYMSQADTITFLCSTYAEIQPGFISLMWQKLEQQNPDFFRAYYVRLRLKEHIMQFNELVNLQAIMMQQQGVIVQPSFQTPPTPSQQPSLQQPPQHQAITQGLPFTTPQQAFALAQMAAAQQVNPYFGQMLGQQQYLQQMGATPQQPMQGMMQPQQQPQQPPTAPPTQPPPSMQQQSQHPTQQPATAQQPQPSQQPPSTLFMPFDPTNPYSSQSPTPMNAMRSLTTVNLQQQSPQQAMYAARFGAPIYATGPLTPQQQASYAMAAAMQQQQQATPQQPLTPQQQPSQPVTPQQAPAPAPAQPTTQRKSTRNRKKQQRGTPSPEVQPPAAQPTWQQQPSSHQSDMHHQSQDDMNAHIAHNQANAQAIQHMMHQRAMKKDDYLMSQQQQQQYMQGSYSTMMGQQQPNGTMHHHQQQHVDTDSQQQEPPMLPPSSDRKSVV